MLKNNVHVELKDGSICHLVNAQAFGYDITNLDDVHLFINYQITEDFQPGQFVIPLERVNRTWVDEDDSLYETFGEPIMLGGVQ